MSRWLSKASNALGRGMPHAPETFELECPCGATIRGVRRDDSQRVLCKDCGEAFFILPTNVYPIPRSRQDALRRARRPQRRAPRADETGAQVATSPPATDSSTEDAAADEAVVSDRQDRLTEPRGIELPAPDTSRRRSFGRLHWALFAAVAAIAATVYGLSVRRATERAEATIRTAVVKGQNALDERDCEAASHQFQQASRALDQLGRDDAQARWIRQMARESTAASELATSSLFEIVTEAQEAHQQSAWQEWQQRFELMYANTWVVLQTDLIRSTDSNGNVTYTLDYPLSVNEAAVDLVTDLDVFQRLPHDSQARPVIVAAQLQSIQPSESAPLRWSITLRPDTAFLWTEWPNLEAIGLGGDRLHEDDFIENLLADQALLMGLE